jgi:Mrp family chromosome partitioning ATPase
MLERPETIYSEPFRILKARLDLSTIEHSAKTIMVTSAVEGEGKSTTVANLAVAAARGGREVVLVDLDFRHPYLRTFFPLAGPKGLTDVALGHISLGEALFPLVLGEEGGVRPGANGSGQTGGTLRLLVAGTLPSSPGEFIDSAAVDNVLAELSRRADLVLIDSAPLLGIGDSLTLASKVDALILVTRLNVLNRPMLRELERALDGCQARPLGIVVTDARAESGYGYTYGYDRTGEHAAGEELWAGARERES